MWLLLGSLVTVVFLITPKTNAEIVDCDFFDTVDLSAARRLWNGAYIYEGLHIPAHLTGEYNFKILPDGTKEKVETHIRGCACKLRRCARVCCPRNNLIQNTVCYMDLENFDWLDPYLKVTLSNGSLVRRQPKTDIIVQWDLPLQCDYMIYLNSKEESDQYTLFENGTFVQDHKYNMILNRPQYCLQHLQFRDENTKYISKKPEPLICLILISKTWNNADY